LDYCQTSSITADSLFEKLELACGPKIDLWIIHNPTLGKNALFPDLIRLMVKKGIHMVLQCHDFAEDGRPTNYKRLTDKTHLYPIAPHVHYAVINRRDADILKNAGLQESHVHYLPNAVMREAVALEENHSPLVFYPVRGIRRKNLGEFCLLAKHAPPGTRFAVAREPENPEWLSGFREWQIFSEKEGLPIEFDVVTEKSTFEHWLSKTSHLATTSIAEGFGLTFIEPHFFGRPLIGRDIPEITSDFKKEGLAPGLLYDRIPIRLDWLDLELLENDFREQLVTNFLAYGTQTNSAAAWKNFIQNGTIDFGNLPESHQRAIIRERHLPELETWLSDALQTKCGTQQDTTPWSLGIYQERLDQLLDTATQSSSAAHSFLPKENVLKEFLDPARFHFLRT
ncbi:hypothetical protein N9051_02675, partial [Akkermansiaceae bacterium]|nr:hypothetical protein [Akkermansiaceae bacterium]